MTKPSKKIFDRDNPEWTKEKIARAVPFSALPAGMQEVLSRHGRGPQKTPTKKQVTMRLSADVLDALRAGGAGWQRRADEILRAGVTRRTKMAGQ